MKKILSIVFLLCCTFFSSTAFSQSVSPETEFLMSVEFKIDPLVSIDQGLLIGNIPSGTISGPNIKGTVHSPSADWLQILPSGVAKTDVRVLIKTDDGEAIYVSYNGILKHSEKSYAKFIKGEEITPDDGIYLVSAPIFRTSSKKYDYLNGIQAIYKMTHLRLGTDGGYVRLEIFAVK